MYNGTLRLCAAFNPVRPGNIWAIKVNNSGSFSIRRVQKIFSLQNLYYRGYPFWVCDTGVTPGHEDFMGYMQNIL